MGASLSIDATSSVVVHDLDVLGAGVGPGEADPPLVVDPDAVLTLAVTPENLQPVAGWRPEIVEVHRGVEVAQLPERRSEYSGVVRPDTLALPEPLGVPVPERPDHASSITRHVN